MSEQRTPRSPAGSAPRYWIRTYGCQMNVHDSEIYAGLLGELGYEQADAPEQADVILVNTCSVRERAEDKLFSELGRLRRLKEGAGAADDGRPREVLVGVTGCIAQQRGGGILERQDAVDFVIGTRAIRALPQVLERVRQGAGPQVVTDDMVEFEAPFARRADRVKAFVTIMEGCNNYCSFCIVPATRGLEVYRPASAILEEIRGLSLRGYREVTLLGQNVNSWVCPETGADFPTLLRRIDEMLEGCERAGERGGVARVRFLTSHPKDLSPALIDAMASCRHVAEHLHLPVQSGSNRILRLMNRRYTIERYLDQVARLRQAVPGVGLSTDLIVGFPGETEEEFEATLELVRTVRYDSFYSFEYSPRPDTAAVFRYRDDVPPLVKRERLVRLQRLGDAIQRERNAAWVGRETTVLVDGVSKRSPDELSGRTSSNQIVNLPGTPAWIGALVDVRIVDAGPHSLRGEAVSPPR